MVGNYSKWSWRPAEQKMKLFTASSFGEHPRPGGGSKGCGRGRDTLTGSKRKRVVERGGLIGGGLPPLWNRLSCCLGV